MKATLLTLALLAGAAQADTIGIHLVSVHVPAAGMKDLNPGIYWRGDNGPTLGMYRNSLGRFSAYAGLTIEEGPFAITGGVIYGYQRKPANCVQVFGAAGTLTAVCGSTAGSRNDWGPLLAPSVRLPEVFSLIPRITVIPGFGGNCTAIHLSIERQI